MGGKPSKGTPADRRLKANQPAKTPAKTAVKSPPVMTSVPARRSGKRG